MVEITWHVETETGDDECGAIEVPKGWLTKPDKLREAVIADFDERGSAGFDDWAEGEIVSIEVEMPNGGWVKL